VAKWSHHYAAGRRTESDLQRIADALDAMAAEIAAGEPGAEGDRAFHRAVAEAAHNPVLLGLLDSIEHDIARIREESLAQRGRPARSLAAHRRVLAAIRRGDPRAAVAEMDAHLAEVADTLLVRGTE
jgi:GntR family transcriptional repressor for pyruvate dehydrogenase complex